MCHKTKIISRVKHGELTLCEGCKNYNLTFNNLFFQFEKNNYFNLENMFLKLM